MDEFGSMDALQSDVVMQEEYEQLKEKLQHLTIVVREQQVLLQTRRIQKEGFDTVSILLKEARQQNTVLYRQKQALETGVRNLQNRLTHQGLSNSVTFEENELYIPGTSKQILENLAKENARLKVLVETVGPFEDVSKLNEMLQDVQSLNTNLRTELGSTQLKIQELEEIVQSLKEERDKLGEEGEGFVSIDRDVDTLKEQLQEFTNKCENLYETLNKKRLPKKMKLINSQSKLDTADGNIVSEENMKLKEEIKALKEMNKRWQEYGSVKERTINDLTSTLQDLQQRYKVSHESHITEEREQELNHILTTAKERIETLTEGKNQVEVQLVHALDTVREQSFELEQIRKSGFGADVATVDALKAQIQICTEDFEKERQDRVIAQNKLRQMNNECCLLRQKNQEMRTSVPIHMRQVATDNVDFSTRQLPLQSFTQHDNVIQPTLQLQSRGWDVNSGKALSDISNGSLDTDGRLSPAQISPIHSNDLSLFTPATSRAIDVGAGPMSLPATTKSTYQSAASSRRKLSADVLCCPKCSKEFSESDYKKLMEHIDICIE